MVADGSRPTLRYLISGTGVIQAKRRKHYEDTEESIRAPLYGDRRGGKIEVSSLGQPISPLHQEKAKPGGSGNPACATERPVKNELQGAKKVGGPRIFPRNKCSNESIARGSFRPARPTALVRQPLATIFSNRPS